MKIKELMGVEAPEIKKQVTHIYRSYIPSKGSSNQLGLYQKEQYSIEKNTGRVYRIPEELLVRPSK